MGAISLAAAGSPLIDAVKKQDAQAVRALLKQKANINAAEADGSTALHWAAQRNDLPLVELLIGAGASAKASTRYNITPLYLAAVNGNAAMMERLVNAGADVNATAEEGQTMLMTAALSGKAEAVRLLLTRGAKVDIKEPFKGQTALMWAAAEGNTAAVDVLLEAGADLKLKSTGGFTPLLFAVRNAHTETAVTLLSEDGHDAFAARDTIDNPATSLGDGANGRWTTYGFTREIPLTNIARGRYLLKVEAKVRGGSVQAVRETLISVR